LGIREERFVDCLYEKYEGRIAIGVGYAQDMMEIFPFVMEDEDGRALGIAALATLSTEELNSVHIFHLSVFRSGRGDGTKLLNILCLKADQLNVKLSLSPVPSPNGEAGLPDTTQLIDWYKKYGFTGDSLLCRLPQTVETDV